MAIVLLEGCIVAFRNSYVALSTEWVTTACAGSQDSAYPADLPSIVETRAALRVIGITNKKFILSMRTDMVLLDLVQQGSIANLQQSRRCFGDE